MINVFGVFFFEKARYLVCKSRSISLKDRLYLPLLAPNDIRCPLLMTFFDTARLLNAFKRVTEGAVSKIMQESSDKGDLSLLWLKFLPNALHLASNHLYECTSGMKHAHRMRKARMHGAGKCKLRDPQLSDAP